MLMVLLTFLGVAGVIFGAYWFIIAEPEEREQRTLRRRLKSEDPRLAKAPASVQLLRQETALSGIAPINAVLESVGGLTDPLSRFIGNSGLPLTVASFLMLTGISSLALGLLIRMYLPVVWIFVPVGLAGLFIPYAVVAYFRSARVLKFEEQFPEAIELIARAMRAGHAFTTGLKIAADELPEPAGPEFRLLYERQNYGAQIPDALKAFAERVPTIDARFFVTAVLTQREAGGNLSEILDRLAAVMRERFRIRREVRVKSAHGRITAYVLAALPPVLAVLMLLINPTQMMLLATDPIGVRLIIAGIVLQLCGVLLVRKIVDIQY